MTADRYVVSTETRQDNLNLYTVVDLKKLPGDDPTVNTPVSTALSGRAVAIEIARKLSERYREEQRTDVLAEVKASPKTLGMLREKVQRLRLLLRGRMLVTVDLDSLRDLEGMVGLPLIADDDRLSPEEIAKRKEDRAAQAAADMEVAQGVVQRVREQMKAEAQEQPITGTTDINDKPRYEAGMVVKIVGEQGEQETFWAVIDRSTNPHSIYASNLLQPEAEKLAWDMNYREAVKQAHAEPGPKYKAVQEYGHGPYWCVIESATCDRVSIGWDEAGAKAKAKEMNDAFAPPSVLTQHLALYDGKKHILHLDFATIELRVLALQEQEHEVELRNLREENARLRREVSDFVTTMMNLARGLKAANRTHTPTKKYTG